MSNLLEGLNPVQQQAVQTTEGPVLILAGAGSGKTRVLTNRTAYLIMEKKVPGNSILMVTFTNKAAGEMKKRVEELLAAHQTEGSKYNTLPFMGTFHSFCSRLLRIEGKHIGLSPNYLIYDADDQKTLIRNILKEQGADIKKINPSAIHAIISQSKNENISSLEYAQIAKGPYQQVVSQVYTEYQKRLNETSALDFDDLLTKSIQLFQSVPEVLDKYQNIFKYLMIDEYQDTNHIQYTLTRLLAHKYNNICVVGDMSQSIYKFRGADIRNIIAFEKDYPKTQVFALEENYRSTQYILDTATALISKNTGHKVLKLFTKNPQGLPIVLYEAQNEVDEAYYILRQILNNDYLYKDVAILYRTNAQSRVLEESFIKSGIPYKLIGGLRFYDRKEIRDLLAYLRVFINAKDQVSLERITKIGKTKLKKFLDFQYQYNQSLEEIKEIEEKNNKDSKSTSKKKSVETKSKNLEFDFFGEIVNPQDIITNTQTLTTTNDSSAQLEDLIAPSVEEGIVLENILKNDPLSPSPATLHSTVDILNKIIDLTDYIEYIDDGTEQGASRIENIKELKTVATQYPDLTQFLEVVSLLEGPETVSGRHKAESEYNAVTLMTMHAAKGLEFKHVFIVGWEEGLFPHSRALLDNSELEEERRLAYVGITRAMQDLYLTYTLSRNIYGTSQSSIISRFISDIPEHLMKFENAYSSQAIGGKNASYRSKVTRYADELEKFNDDVSW
jgi:DNA helicase-2/ATP-dependent DNA helicase PcrA